MVMLNGKSAYISLIPIILPPIGAAQRAEVVKAGRYDHPKGLALTTSGLCATSSTYLSSKGTEFTEKMLLYQESMKSKGGKVKLNLVSEPNKI